MKYDLVNSLDYKRFYHKLKEIFTAVPYRDCMDKEAYNRMVHHDHDWDIYSEWSTGTYGFMKALKMTIGEEDYKEQIDGRPSNVVYDMIAEITIKLDNWYLANIKKGK